MHPLSLAFLLYLPYLLSVLLLLVILKLLAVNYFLILYLVLNPLHLFLYYYLILILLTLPHLISQIFLGLYFQNLLVSYNFFPLVISLSFNYYYFLPLDFPLMYFL